MDTTIIGAWAISGPAFLGLYAVAFLATVVVFERRRRRILGPGGCDDSRHRRSGSGRARVPRARRSDTRVIALLDLERRDVLRIDSATARRQFVEAEPDADRRIVAACCSPRTQGMARAGPAGVSLPGTPRRSSPTG